jgi:hypothetical protein
MAAQEIVRGGGADEGTGKASPATASPVPAASASSGGEECVGYPGGDLGTGAATPATGAPGHADPCSICAAAEDGAVTPRHWCPDIGQRSDLAVALADTIDAEWDASCRTGEGPEPDVRSPGQVAVDVLFDSLHADVVMPALAEGLLLELVDEGGAS